MPGLVEAPNLHPLFLHFPLALIPTALLFWLLALAKSSDEMFRFGRWLLYLGVLAAVPTIVTGFRAEEQFGHQEIIHVHRNFMLAGAALSSLTCLGAFLLRRATSAGARRVLTVSLAAS